MQMGPFIDSIGRQGTSSGGASENASTKQWSHKKCLLTVEATTAGRAELPRTLVQSATWLPDWEPPGGHDSAMTDGRAISSALARRVEGVLRELFAAHEEMLGRVVCEEGDETSVDSETALLDALDEAVKAGDDAEYRSLLSQLRALQEAEARRMRDYFETHRPLAAGAGYAALAEARALLEGHESPSEADDAADSAD